MRSLLRFIRMLNMPCKDISRLISRAQDDRLPRAERFVVASHLLYCKACRRFKKQLAVIRQAAEKIAETGLQDNRLADVPGLSDEARQRIKRTLSD